MANTNTKAHPFLPRSVQKGPFLKWLRRTHSWLGTFGAAGAILFGFTAITLQHHDFGIDTTPVTTASVYEVPAGVTIASTDDLGHLVKQELEIFGGWQEGAGRGMGAATGLAVTFNSPGDVVVARYNQEASVVEIDVTERGFLATINRLHLGNGISPGWKLFSDVVAWSFIVLVITGIGLWVRTHGPAVLALSLLGFTLIVSSFYFFIGA